MSSPLATWTPPGPSPTAQPPPTVRLGPSTAQSRPCGTATAGTTPTTLRTARHEPLAGLVRRRGDDEEAEFLASHGFKVGDQVRVDLAAAANEIPGGADGADVVMTTISSRNEYLGPSLLSVASDILGSRH